MTVSLPAILRAIWAYRYVVLAAFLLLFGIDLIVSGVRILLFEGIIFLLGVFVGYRASHGGPSVPQVDRLPVERPDLNHQFNQALAHRQHQPADKT